MLVWIITLIGLFFGIFLEYFARSEIKSGRIYFKILEVLILIVLIIVSFNFEIVALIIGLICGFILRKEYFYFGIGIVTSLSNKNLSFLYSSLVFVYGMPYGTLLAYEKEMNKLYLDLILFTIPLVLLFFKFDLLQFSIGALISITVIKIAKLISFK